jgi:hypothetical protein
MFRLILQFLLFASAASVFCQVHPVHTFSIVARDSVTGEPGVAVQSHWFPVGSLVPWAGAGVGAVATQSSVDPAYGPLGLEIMRAGKTARQALEGCMASDPGKAVRQVAMVDARDNVAPRLPSVGLLNVDDTILRRIFPMAGKRKGDH